ncbi:MAG TPA: hypothetical protein VGS27_06485 [Candidatus Sulfotelmatobacter sp.]|nr:hypothetical protein [Candidatus Sulfotelmatobacter sp.]
MAFDHQRLLLGGDFGVRLHRLPKKTPFWIWAVVSGVALILANALFLRRKSTAKARKTPLWGDIVIGLGFFGLILDLLFATQPNSQPRSGERMQPTTQVVGTQTVQTGDIVDRTDREDG